LQLTINTMMKLIVRTQLDLVFWLHRREKWKDRRIL